MESKVVRCQPSRRVLQIRCLFLLSNLIVHSYPVLAAVCFLQPSLVVAVR